MHLDLLKFSFRVFRTFNLLCQICVRTNAVGGGEHPAASHPGQSEVHLQLGHPPPNAGPHAHPERDEAVGVVLVVAALGSAPTQPALRQELLSVHKLRLVVTDGVVTQMVQSLKIQKPQVGAV